MKKLFLILVCAVATFAVTASRIAVDATYASDLQERVTSIDTLDGADSVTIYNDVSLEPGYQFMISTPALSGDSAANTVLELIVRAFDKDGNLTGRVIADTIAAAGELSLLPIRETIVGNYYDILLKSVNANDETVVSRVHLWRRWLVAPSASRRRFD